ncbi:hypothetical protein ACFQXB_01610 [Plastorhodobacter daqingensis]|uniref:Uncharacterized protein n=1 Tax=Plastorhodobacter daqingensis TaxID=1387281 RepID=A0ABW2UDX4_9RHOB
MALFPKITATAAAVAIALSAAVATPAQAATNQDLQRLLYGAAGIAALGLILNEGRKNQAQAAPSRGGNPHRAAALPASCARDERTRNGWETFYETECLRRAGFRNLPGRCEVRMGNPRDRGRTMLSGACLQQAGYQPERRGWR